jgi:outer membrane protein assembly factor BamE
MNKLTLIVFSLPFLSACSEYIPELPSMSDITPSLSLPTSYKANVYQGSVLDRFTINQLKLGMAQAQVQDLIGSPSVIDPFHNNQWDYINHSTSYEADVSIRYRLKLTFENGLLSNIDTTGITSLPELTSKEKKLENQHIAAEAKADRIAAEKVAAEMAAKAKIEVARIAKEKAQAEKEAEIKKSIEEKVAAEMAAKAKIEAARIAKEKAQAEKEVNTKEKTNEPWYQFW